MSCSHKIGYILKDVTKGIIVQQVNAQGAMGSGIALGIKTKWHKVWEEYTKAIQPNQADNGFSHMGKVIYVEVEPGLWVANIVGQQFYGNDKSRVYTSYEALEMGFHSVANFAKNNDLEVHCPLNVGCGLANGDWEIVSKFINERLADVDHTFWQLPTAI